MTEQPTAYGSFPPEVRRIIAQLQAWGDNHHGPGFWRTRPAAEHIEHAVAHLTKRDCGDTTEMHLVHAAIRLIFAVAVEIEQGTHSRDYIPPKEHAVTEDEYK